MNQEGVLACCAVCSEKTHRRCGGCLTVYYCNKEHQRQDWKRHKSECAPKGPKHTNSGGDSTVSGKAAGKEKEEKSNIIENSKLEESNQGTLNAKRRPKKTKFKKNSKEGSVDGVSKHTAVSSENVQQCADNRCSESSVISSVLCTNKDSSTKSAITYEGSSENEILNENAQQLSTVDFYAAAGSSNVLRAVNRSEVKMPVLPEQPARAREYPEASLQGSGAPFSHSANSYYMDPSDPCYEVCQRVIRDMTQYGVCVLNNFLGREKGLTVLNEVLQMYNTGIFKAGQLVSTTLSTETQTIRSDLITWIDGKEQHCYYIGQLMARVDNIILRANKMANNGRMGDFLINGRTKAMVACYPGSGAHYVKHVDNPNKDGRCITAIYYLNLDWDVQRCGGLLRVFPAGNDNKVADIEPIFDRMLFFWSDRRNPHEVQPAFSTRYAITLWYFDAQERAEARKNRKRVQPSSSK